MDAVNKTFAPLGELVRGMAPGARLAAAAGVAVLIASAVWVAGQRGAGPGAYLMGGESFTAAELREMESAFGKAGLEDYEIDGQRVRVPRGQQAKYMAALSEGSALPREFGDHLKSTVSGQGFTLPGWRQEAQTKIAVQHELQQVIQRMRGIEKAFVHIAEETSRGFPQTKTVTASVGVEPRGGAALDEGTVAAIRSFVASAWGGLKPEAVTVLDLSGNRAFTGAGSAKAQASAARPAWDQRTRESALPRADRPAAEVRVQATEADARTIALEWCAGHWQALGLGGLIVFGMLLLRSTMRAAPNRACQHVEPAGAQAATLEDRAPPAVERAAAQPARLTASLQAELAEAIRQNPQAATGVLRTWLGTARANG